MSKDTIYRVKTNYSFATHSEIYELLINEIEYYYWYDIELTYHILSILCSRFEIKPLFHESLLRLLIYFCK
jgi:hypothetical protein